MILLQIQERVAEVLYLLFNPFIKESTQGKPSKW
jgi:hypothetical protein